MTKKLIASVLAASIAITGMTAAPARALDNGELGRLIFGTGALIIIGSALANRNNNNNNGAVVTRRGGDADRPRRHHRKIAPARCVRHSHFNNGPRRFLGQRCLNRHMHNAHRLPSACKRKVYTNNGRRNVFGARCLRNHGWTFG